MTKPEGTIRTKTNGNIQQKIGNKWVYIGCDSELKKKANAKSNAKFQKKPWKPNFPPVTLPDHIRPTNYPHYYVSNDGIAYREPRRCDKDGRFGEVNEWGLIQLTTSLRGNPNYGEDYMYEGTNIYFYDENGKNVGYKKKNIHQLVAEAWIPNPHGYNEVLHGAKGNRCNHYTNLRWGTHKENMKEASHALPDGTQKRSHGKNGSLYEKKDGEWVLVPKLVKGAPNGTVSVHKNGERRIKIDGKWFYMPKPKKPKPKKPPRTPRKIIPNGTIKTNKNGQKWIKIDGEWVYQKKERVEEVFETGPDVKYNKKGDKYKRINGKWVYQRKIKDT